jgi:hypothetical protein
MIYKIEIDKAGERLSVEADKITKSMFNKDMITIHMPIGLMFDVFDYQIESITKIR